MFRLSYIFHVSLSGRTGTSFESSSADTIRKLREFCDIEERRWKKVLVVGYLRQSRLWKSVPPPPQGIDCPSSRVDREILVCRRALEILYSTPSLFFPSLKPGERTTASYLMSLPPYVTLSGDGGLERLRQLKNGPLKKKSKAKTPVAPTPPPTCGSQDGKKKRHVDINEYALEDRDICLTFPPTAHAYSDFSPHFEESKKLLFPSDRETFNQIGLAAVGQTGSANVIKVYLTFDLYMSFMLVFYGLCNDYMSLSSGCASATLLE